MDKDTAWSFGALTGVLTGLIGWLPGLIAGAIAETHSAAYKAAHTGGQALGYWSFLPWREGFIAGWVLTVLPVALVVWWFLGRPKFMARNATHTASGLVFGAAAGVGGAFATIIVGIVIGVAFLILPIGALFLILG